MFWGLGLVLVLDPLIMMASDQLCCLLERGGKDTYSLVGDFIGFGVKLKREIELGYPFGWIRKEKLHIVEAEHSPQKQHLSDERGRKKKCY